MVEQLEHMTTNFGYQKVPINEKQNLVDEVFDKVAKRYDIMNDVMSGGLHRLWKNALVTKLSPPKQGQYPFRILDVAGGTGDIAFRMADMAQGYSEITVCDINASMLAVGAKHAHEKGFGNVLRFVQANAESLAFADVSFDAYTIAFGIRNVPRIDIALREAYRVLRPGGRFLCLEFSHVDVPVLDNIYDLYSNKIIPTMGRVIAGDSEPYQYLVESIRTFPRQEIFAKMLSDAGFSRVTWTNLTGGISALHSAWKI